MAALRVGGTLRVPGDKSISHRALLTAALADGESVIRDILISGDVAATASVLREMGVELAPLSQAVTVRGRGLRGLTAPGVPLDCGNSGTTARLAAGVVAAQRFSATFVGDRSLTRRPMRRLARPLEAMGASIEFAGGDGLPMTVHGADLHEIDWVLEQPSAQIKSAILFAALSAGVSARVRGGGRSRDHTERMLASVGASVETDDGTVVLHPTEDIPPMDFAVPGDVSSAAYFAALAVIATEGELEITGIGLNPTRTGGLEVLRAMGGGVDWTVTSEVQMEPVGSIRARPGELRALTVRPEDVPELLDELPLLACVAAVAHGETVVTGAAELRVKESDRIATVVGNLRAIGVDAEELPDGFMVRGSDRPLHGTIRTEGDHRIAMSFGILARRPGNAIRIDDPECAAVSYPSFWSDLDRVIVP